MKIITESSVFLSNGFQSGEFVIFLVQDLEGKWVQEKRKGTGECTWHDDEKISDMEVSLVGKKGIVGCFYGTSAHSRQKSLTGFFGFSEEELSEIISEQGYTCKDHGFNAYDWEVVKTLEEYLEARFLWDSFTPWSSMKDGIHKMPYQWGDQAADSFALIKEGKLVDSSTGCGDRTPYLTESEEKCLAEGRLYTSNQMYDNSAEQAEYENDFWSVAKRLGLEDEYDRLCRAEYSESNQKKLSELARRIDAQMFHEYANQRADKDKTGVLRRLLKHYRHGQNPLKSLRKEKGGEWRFHRDFPSDLSDRAVIYHGENWWVSWVK